MGAVSDSGAMVDFDTTTAIGAMENIIVYAQETWGAQWCFVRVPGMRMPDINRWQTLSILRKQFILNGGYLRW